MKQTPEAIFYLVLFNVEAFHSSFKSIQVKILINYHIRLGPYIEYLCVLLLVYQIDVLPSTVASILAGYDARLVRIPATV